MCESTYGTSGEVNEIADNATVPSILTRDEIEEMEKEVRFHTTRQGAKLAFHEYGDPNGHPVFFYHGTGSHVHGMLLHKPGLKHGFRIIAPDRPGVAQSDFLSGWTVLEYAQDMADLADRLEIGSFGAIGISGGGPTLMATAFLMPDRLRCVVDLACAMPLYGNPEMSGYLGTMDPSMPNSAPVYLLPSLRFPFPCSV